MTNILTPKQIKDIKVCGKCLSNALGEVIRNSKIGIKTIDLDKIAEDSLLKQECTPTFKNFFVAGQGHYPATLCISINEEIVHGIPTHHRILKEGDVVSFDLGARYNGVCTDMATTILIGKTDDERKKQLIDVTKKSLEIGIKEAKVGNFIGDIGYAIQSYAESFGFGIVREYVGHGIGTEPHLSPQIPNYGAKRTGARILEGMALAIEPMLTLGDYRTIIHEDGWTVKTLDQSVAAHFEHTVVIIDKKPIIVTN